MGDIMGVIGLAAAIIIVVATCASVITISAKVNKLGSSIDD